MPDLEPQITQWRKSLDRDLNAIAREELETHLRELIQAELRKGGAADRAFQQAVARLGDLAAISGEFRKLDRAFWWPIRAAFWAAIAMAVLLPALFVHILFKKTAYPELQLLLATHVFTITSGYLLTFLLGGLAICFSVQHIFTPLNPPQSHALAKAASRIAIAAAIFTAIGIGLGMIWAHNAWGRAWGWDNKEVGGLGVLTFLLIFTIYQHITRSPQQTMLLPLLGNIVVASAWFQFNIWVVAITSVLSLLSFGVVLHRRQQIPVSG